MSEFEPKPSEQKVASYESQVKKDYSELGDEGLDAKHWGTAKSDFFRDNVNFYTNKDYIRIKFVSGILPWLEKKKEVGQLTFADLGGDNGFLLDEISKMIRGEYPTLDFKGFVVDVDSTGRAEQKFKKEQELGERKQLEFVRADVTALPFNDESLDLIISRMAMQYLDSDQQDRFLFEVDRVLKEGGIFQIMTVEDNSEGQEYNKILAEITSIISGSSSFNRVFPDIEKFWSFEEKLEQSGSSLHLVFRTEETEMPLSVEGFADRFKLDEKQIERMRDLYKIKAKKYPDMFEEIDGVLCLKTRIVFQEYKKDED